MRLLAAFLVLFVGLLYVQLGDPCGPIRRPPPTCNHTKTNNTESAGLRGLQFTPPQEGDSVLWNIVQDGAHRGLYECQKVFAGSGWNCPGEMYQKLPIFDNKTFPYATRETAVIHAFSAATITDEITHQCRHNRTPGCDCPQQKTTEFNRREGVTWGCSDNIEFGEKEARRFTDRLEKGPDALVAVNLHNNEVGREVVRTSAVVSCKCHGYDSYDVCSMRTCWRELAPFEVVASKLKEKYHEAMRVRLVHKELRDLLDREVSVSHQTLVYLDNSPSFCEQNDTLGYPGMLGRSCRSDVSKDKCEFFVELCNGCNLRAEKVERYKRVKCNCKFIYCCKVECEKCKETYFEITCSALKAVEKDIVGRF